MFHLEGGRKRDCVNFVCIRKGNHAKQLSFPRMTCSAMPFVRGFLFFLRFFLRGVLDCSLEDQEESVDPDVVSETFVLSLFSSGSEDSGVKKIYSYIN